MYFMILFFKKIVREFSIPYEMEGFGGCIQKTP